MIKLLRTLTLLNIILVFTAQAFKLEPQKHPIVFAFDIHGVLMQLKNKEMAEKLTLLHKIDNKPIKQNKVDRHHPINDTWDIAKQLKAIGYPLYIFSNIGEKTFIALMAKFPNWFEIFDGYHTVRNNDRSLIKPRSTAYASFKKMVYEKHPADTRIIFIDDRKENIDAAQEAGFVAILFESAEQLQRELGLLV